MEQDTSSKEALEPKEAGPIVVGIGASAGGLAALKELLNHVPAGSGLALVVVVHLSPGHESQLAEVLQPHVPLPVEQVLSTTPLKANHVYVIPPNANISAIDTHLRLTKLEERRQQRAPIDHFFRTLATTHDGNAIGVILTGTGSDGTLGIKEIKAKGGLVIVQDPNEAEYDGMPQSAIASGLVDRVLPLAQIPEAILRFERTEPKIPLVQEGGEIPANERILLQKVFALLRTRTDRDFSRYKRSTVLRCIARRMQLNYIEDLGRYLHRLREQPEEVRALADDLLITVTHFFRDPEVFEKLEKDIIPRIFNELGIENNIRIWSVGCATGEEAYSLAMILVEEATRRDLAPHIQVFASDLHRRSLDKAREGFYSGDIATDITPERLARFFQKENGGYRIRKEIRDLLVFATHNLLSDPPFSRLDLISCRNLLIYLERDVQREVIELFHHALNPDGVLLLGSAESLDAADLFRTEDKKLCLFRKRDVPAREPRLPVFPLTRARVFGETPQKIDFQREPVVYGALHLEMLERFAPPSILVNADNRIVHLSGHGGHYLLHPGGEATASVFRLVREELRVELQALLNRARSKKEMCSSRPIPVQFNGHAVPVVMHARPGIDARQEGLVLILFEEREEAETTEASGGGPAATDARSERLEAEVRDMRQRLQAIIEEYETSQEEMNASSEEMQSTNEELRATVEELETSKEELQSINEELQTVNQHNRYKVEELAQLSNDLQNLLSATDIATLFLDRSLRILRFTPKLAELFSVRITDQGRSIGDLTNRLGYDDLLSDAAGVLERLVPVEREIQDDAGRWYVVRVRPYRSTEDRIEGVVITFIDIDTRKRIEEALKIANEALVRANGDLRYFSYASSHDLREPMRRIRTYSELLEKSLREGDQAQLLLSTQYIREGADRMSQLVIDWLANTGVIGDDQAPAQLVDLNSALAKSLENLKQLIDESHAEVTHDPLPAIVGQETLLILLFQNLLDNAIKYRGDEPPRIHIGALRIGNEWRISVADNGSGIDPAYHQQIFGLFKRLHAGDKPGTGRGLALCRRVVEQYGGRIWVESAAGKGAAFYFTLKAAADTP